MPSDRSANSIQMTMMNTALDEHCRDFGIEPDSEDRNDAARLILSFFQRGMQSVEEFKAAMAATRARLRG